MEGEVYQVYWEEYRVVRRVREEYNVENKGKEKQYHLPYNIKADGKNIKWERGERDGNFGEEKKFGGKKYEVVGNFVNPCIILISINTII